MAFLLSCLAQPVSSGCNVVSCVVLSLPEESVTFGLSIL